MCPGVRHTRGTAMARHRLDRTAPPRSMASAPTLTSECILFIVENFSLSHRSINQIEPHACTGTSRGVALLADGWGRRSSTRGGSLGTVGVSLLDHFLGAEAPCVNRDPAATDACIVVVPVRKSMMAGSNPATFMPAALAFSSNSLALLEHCG